MLIIYTHCIYITTAYLYITGLSISYKGLVNSVLTNSSIGRWLIFMLCTEIRKITHILAIVPYITYVA